jgi:hypothetical protein
MQIISNNTSALSLSAVLIASLGAGCLSDAGAAQGDERDGLDETAQESGGSTASVTPLPSFATTPNIQQAIAKLSNPSAIAVVKTISGFQIYRCELGTAAPEWRLRTPLAGLAPSFDVQRPVLNLERLAGLVGAYHYRSDFGGLAAPAQLAAIGLVAPTTAPVWDFTLQPSGGAPRHEVLAGRVLAQDATSAESIPMLLLEVRGRSIDAGTPSALAPATHLLRWNTRGGVAPAASACTTETLGREAQSPYAAEYYFLQTAP